MKIGFISDIHEDFDSLQAAVSLLERHGCDEVVCLGDIVGFTLPFQRYIARRDAEACVSLVRSECSVVVAGNHDLYAVRRTPSFQAGFDYGDDWYSLSYEARAKRSRNRVWLYEDSEMPPRLSADSIEFLRSLNEYEVYLAGGVRYLFSHFHYPDVSGSTIAVPRRARHLGEHFGFMARHGCQISVSGHGHPEGYALCEGKRLHFGGFAAVQLDHEPCWCVCPCTANTTRRNGVLILDCDAGMLEAVALGSPKIIV